ncbi:MAG: hypothetical protein AAF824_03275 [Bacteroidota bacterium]
MKKLLIYTFLFSFSLKSDPWIYKAKEAFQQQQYASCLAYLAEAKEADPSQMDQYRFNEALVYEAMDSISVAYLLHFQLSKSDNLPLASLSTNQLGVFHCVRNQWQQALAMFREALIKDPANELARFNYEWVVKHLSEIPASPEEETNDPNEEDSPEDVNSPSRRRYYRPKTPPPSGGDPTDEMRFMPDSLSLNQVLQQMERLTEREIQYIQQLKKAPVNFPGPLRSPRW